MDFEEWFEKHDNSLKWECGMEESCEAAWNEALKNQLRLIESAPKDGTYIILFGPSGYMNTPLRCQIGYYDAEYRNPWRTYDNEAFVSLGDEPTHWMPIPELSEEK